MTPEQMRRAADWLEAFPDLAHSIARSDLARLLREQAEAMGWRPIETAPRDGTALLVLLQNRDGHSMTTALWETLWNKWFLCESGSYSEDDACDPTHWQPLPPPPEGGK